MNPDQYREALATRRAELDAERETLRLQRDDIETRDALLALRAEELSWALEQFDLAPPPPAQEKKPKEKAPLTVADFIAAIRSSGIDIDDMTDRSVTDALKAKGHGFRITTVRRALIEIGQQNRASAQPESDAIRKDEGSPLDSAPESGGAVTDGFPDTPAFLKRAPSGIAKAAE